MDYQTNLDILPLGLGSGLTLKTSFPSYFIPAISRSGWCACACADR